MFNVLFPKLSCFVWGPNVTTTELCVKLHQPRIRGFWRRAEERRELTAPQNAE